MDHGEIEAVISDFVNTDDVLQHFRQHATQEQIQMCIRALASRVSAVFGKDVSSSVDIKGEQLPASTIDTSQTDYKSEQSTLVQTTESVAGGCTENLQSTDVSDIFRSNGYPHEVESTLLSDDQTALGSSTVNHIQTPNLDNSRSDTDQEPIAKIHIAESVPVGELANNSEVASGASIADVQVIDVTALAPDSDNLQKVELPEASLDTIPLGASAEKLEPIVINTIAPSSTSSTDNILADTSRVTEPVKESVATVVPTTVAPPAPIHSKFTFALKGGKLQVGVPYDGYIEGVNAHSVARIIQIELTEDCGLTTNSANPAQITGIPTRGGDLVVQFKYQIEGETSVDRPALSSNLSVFINHDPRSLWKDLPSDQSDPNWKADTDVALLSIDERKIVAASKRGRSHAHEGKFRDDDFRIESATDSGWKIVAVADGAGSASKSRRGSQIAMKSAVDSVFAKLNSEAGKHLEELVAKWQLQEVQTVEVISGGLYPVLGVSAFEACKAIEAEALALGVAVKEFSTTLLITAYKKLEVGYLFATYWVGDGAVGLYMKDGSSKLLGKVDSGEFAGQTRFLDRKVMTTEEIAARLQFAVVDDFKALVAMTDGITDPWFQTDNNLENDQYWKELWAQIEPALNSESPEQALLDWLDFWSAGNHDDRTIAVVW